MKKFISMLLRHWSKTPLKVSLTLCTVALGTGILIISFSASSILNEKIGQELENDGVILYAANGSWSAEGSIDLQRPAEWDIQAPELVVSDIDKVVQTAIVDNPPLGNITTGGISYEVRSIAGSEPQYFDIFSLGIVAGAPMSEEDVVNGFKKVWISEETANTLFGSPEEAIGQWIQPPGEVMRRGPGGRREQNLIIQFSVAGVFSTPSEIARQAYGIADIVIPYTAMLPGGGNITVQRNMMAGQFVLKADSSSIEKVSANVRQVLAGEYGDDIEISVWEGSLRGTSDYMDGLRQAVNIFTVTVNILGLVLLLTSSLGIFSIMVVESLDRRREIALERAIGASQHMVVKEFWTWSLALTSIGALLGVLLAFFSSGPVLGTLQPLLGEIAAEFSTSAGIQLPAVLLGLLLAIGCGGLLGLLPAFSAVKGSISDTLREG